MRLTKDNIAFILLVGGMMALLMLLVGLVTKKVVPGLDNARLIERWVGW